MAFRIERGAFKIFDSTLGRYKERFKFNDSGNFVELNADGTEKGATFTTDGGTVTGAAHFTHTSNTYAGASATLTGRVQAADFTSSTGRFASTSDGGTDCYMYISDANNTYQDYTYGGEFSFAGDTGYGNSILIAGGLQASRGVRAQRFYINDAATTLEEGNNNSLRIQTSSGRIDIGSMNSGFVHMQADRDIYILPGSNGNVIHIDGHLRPYSDGTVPLGSTSRRWNGVYGTNGDFSGNLVVGGTITAQEFHTEFVNQTIIHETGDVQVDGELTFTGAATTSNQSYGIVWSGFDKEGTTDFSDSAYIKHTTNTGGFSGSVLVIRSANDGNDGIAFSTHASSNLKHNGNVIWTAGNDGAGSGLDADMVDGVHVDRIVYGTNATGTTTLSESNLGGYLKSGAYTVTRNGSGNMPNQNTSVNFLQRTSYHSVGNRAGIDIFANDSTTSKLYYRVSTGGGNGAWKVLATEDWVASQGGLSQSTADTRYQPIGNYFTDGDTVLNMANNDGLEYNDSNNLMYVKADGANYQIIDSRGGTFTGSIIPNGGINMNNRAITRVNNLTFDDPGPNEGIAWNGGNGFSIYESPNDLTTNSAGNLQFVRSGNRLLTLTSGNNVEIPNKLLIGGANDNSGKADFAVGNSNQISWMSSQVQIGATDMNWGGKAYYSSGFHIGAWDVNLRLFTQGGANNRDIIIEPQRNGSPTEVARFKGEGYMYFPGLQFAISTVNSDHGVANYFRGSNTHLVIGTGGTLYLNYGQSGGDTRMYGTIWHNDVQIGTPWGNANDGAGSGLDADTVDGIQASSLLRSDANDTASGRIDFTASESIRLKGIRGQFSNEYIHLYHKVGIGHPGGWGQGEGDTPGYGLSTYGGLNIAYGNNAASIFKGSIEVNTTSPVVILDDSNATNTTNLTAYMSFQVNGTENGWVGYGSSGNSDLTLKNNSGWVVLNASSGVSVRGGSLRIDKSGTDSYIHFPSQTNDPGYIRHYESNNTARMYFSVSDDNSTTDFFGFGYSGDQTRFVIYSNGQWESKGNGTVQGNVYADRFIDRNNHSFIIDPANTSYLNRLDASILYDRDDTNYFVNPSSHTKLQRLSLNAGGENIDIDVTTGQGQADDVLFDMTRIIDTKSTIGWANGNIIHGIPSSEYVNTDTPFPGGVAIRTNTNRNIYSDYIPVEAGEELYGEIWARHIEGDDNATILYYGIEQFDKDKRPIASNTGCTYFVAGGARNIGTSWRKYSNYRTLPTSHTAYNGSDGGAVKYVRVRILLNYSATGPTREYGGIVLKRTRVKHSKWFTQLGVGTGNNKSFDLYNNGTTYFNGVTTLNSAVTANSSMSIAGSLTVNDDIRIENSATHDRLEKGSAFINPRDPWDNFHLHGEYGSMYFDSSNYFFRSTNQQTTWVTINSNGIGIGISPSSNYKLTLSGAGIRMNNNPIHYTSEIHFNSGSRFKSFSSTYTEHRSDSGTSTGIALSTAGSVRGYLYAENNNHIGILDAGASWGIRHRNDEGTEFFTDNATKEFSIGRDLVTGNYGTVQTHTTRGSYGGYSINGQYVFMADHGSNVGLYNDIDNEWMIYMKRNAEVELMYNGSTKLETTNTGVTISGHIQVNAPAAPAGASCTIVGDTIEVSFDPSPNTVDYYQVWASQDGGSYSLISQVPKQDFAPLMTVVDTAFSVSGTRAYRVYAVKNGVYSDPATTSRTYTQPALEPVNMSVVPMEEAFFVQWSAPDSRFVDHYEVWVDTHATQSSLSRSNATLVYSGNNTFYMHAASSNEYHQFWVEIIES